MLILRKIREKKNSAVLGQRGFGAGLRFGPKPRPDVRRISGSGSGFEVVSLASFCFLLFLCEPKHVPLNCGYPVGFWDWVHLIFSLPRLVSSISSRLTIAALHPNTAVVSVCLLSAMRTFLNQLSKRKHQKG